VDDFNIAAFPVRATDGVGMSVIETGARIECHGPWPPTQRLNEISLLHKQKRRLPKETAFPFDHDT